MTKQTRQTLGLISAVLAYYLIHEGAHLIYALMAGVFKQVNFMGLIGVQIEIDSASMTDSQLGMFCLVGSVATAITAYLLVLVAGRIGAISSKVLKACLYYITIIMLFADPLYLGVLFKFFGGGDMNGISLLIPQNMAQGIYGAMLLLNGFLFWKIVLPKYKLAFS